MGILPEIALLSERAADCGAILLDASAKGLAVLAVAGAVSLAMRRAPAAWRHMLWLLVMVSLLALPILSAALPGWQVLPDWLNPSFTRTPAENAKVVAPGPPVGRLTESLTPEEMTADVPPGFAPIPGDMPVSAGPAIPPADPTVAAGEPSKPPGPVTISVWLLGAWLAGVAACLAPLALGRLSLFWLSRRAQRVKGPWPALIASASAQVGLRRRVRLLVSDRRPMPMVWGVFRPTLLLPAEADRWPEDRRRVVLLHELAHAARRDCLAKVIAHAACAVYWFNPLAWLAFRQMQREAEAACDDRVLNAGAEPPKYAEHILQIASGLEANLLAAHSAIAMARKSRLEGRLLAILDGARNRRKLTRTAAVILLALIVAISIPLACMQPRSEPAAKEEIPSPHEASRQTAERTLEFRVAPPGLRRGEESVPSDELKRQLDWLKQGRVGQWWRDDPGWSRQAPAYLWLPIHDRAREDLEPMLVTGEYQGRRYLLVSNKPDDVMETPEKESPSWGLTEPFPTPDAMDRPALGVQFDKAGAEKFYALTSSHLSQPLAIIVGGRSWLYPRSRPGCAKRP